jgi:hypothetical protein
MGLFVAARIADLQDIKLTLEPSQGAGASFRIAFPIAQREAAGDHQGNGMAAAPA